MSDSSHFSNTTESPTHYRNSNTGNRFIEEGYKGLSHAYYLTLVLSLYPSFSSYEAHKSELERIAELEECDGE